MRADLSERLSYRLDNLMTWHPITKVVGLFLVSALHILLGAVLYALVLGEGPGTALWRSWTYTADPGTHADESQLAGMLVSAGITVGGMIFFAVFVGLVTDAIGERVDELKRGRSRVIEEGHTLVLGWSDKLLPLLRQLALANESEGGGVVVILAERDKEEMEAEIQEERDALGRTTVVCRTGSPSSTHDLMKVAAPHARAVVVLAPDDDTDSDAAAVRTVLALCQGLDRLSGHVAVELRDRENIRLVEMVGGQQVEPVIARDMVGRLMVQCARQPGLAQIYAAMLGFEGDEFYLQRWPALEGRTFGELRRMFADAVVCGVRVHDEPAARLSPPDDLPLGPGDQLLVLAEDNDSYRPSAAPRPVDAGALPPPPTEDAPLERVLFCGWRQDLDDMLLELDSYVAPGSEAAILAELPLAERAERLWRDTDRRPRNLSLTQLVGSMDARRDLEGAHVEQYDAIIILADEVDGPGGDRQDSRALVSLLLIRDIQQRRGARRATLISEITDPRTKRLVSVTDASDYVVSNELISMTLAAVAEHRELNAVWMELFSADGCEIYLKPLALYADASERLSFDQLAERARAHSHIALFMKVSNLHIAPAAVNPDILTRGNEIWKLVGFCGDRLLYCLHHGWGDVGVVDCGDTPIKVTAEQGDFLLGAFLGKASNVQMLMCINKTGDKIAPFQVQNSAVDTVVFDLTYLSDNAVFNQHCLCRDHVAAMGAQELEVFQKNTYGASLRLDDGFLDRLDNRFFNLGVCSLHEH